MGRQAAAEAAVEPLRAYARRASRAPAVVAGQDAAMMKRC
jgi:hypothetical protein